MTSALPVVTVSQRTFYAIHLDDSVCPLIFHIAKVSHSPLHIHVRVTWVIRWQFAAHFVDVAGLWNFEVHDWNTAKVALLRDGGASSTALVIEPRSLGQESRIASAVTGWRLEAAAQEGRASSDVGVARELESRTQCAARLYRVRESGDDCILQDGKSHPAALPAASSVCRGCVATTLEPRCEFLQRLLPDQRRELRRHGCFNARICELGRFSDTELQRFAMTDIEENVPSAGQMSSELLPNFQMQPMLPLWEAR